MYLSFLRSIQTGSYNSKALDLHSGALAILAKGFHGIPQSLQGNPEIIPQLSHYCFLPNSFKLNIQNF
jgi:hypothetical protein